jgi:polysaccharide export outer membrane protein
LVALAGCRTIDPYSPALQPPVPTAMLPAREKSMVSLPAYRIEPPDIISIEMLKLIPLPPYRAEVFDVLQIHAQNPLPEQPLDGGFIVEGEGTINLGPSYGTVRVAGMTIDEIRVTIEQSLSKLLRNPGVTVSLLRASGFPPISGTYLVASDGTVNLRQYGVIYVAGKTVTEARIAVENHLKQFLDSPQAAVDVINFNSKFYYVVTQGAGLGDSIHRFPITGNETALDAITQVNGLSQVSSKHIWIARPAAGNFGCQQILPIEWDAITQGGQTATNYQIMPGDRVYIAEDELVTFSNTMGKVTAPMERLGGIMSLGSSTIRGFQTMGRGYNATRNGI